MPVSAVSPVVEHIGNGVTTVFPYGYKILANADMTVWLDDVLQTGGYTVSGAGVDAGGNVTFSVAPAASVVVRLQRVVSLARTTDYQEGGAFRADQVDTDQDKQTMQIQQVNEEVSRSLKFPPGSPPAAVYLPTPEPLKFLGWDQSASAVVNYDPADFATLAATSNWKYKLVTGDGTAMLITLDDNPGVIANLDISVGGVTQTPVTDYTVSGKNVQFIGIVPIGEPVLIRYGTALPQGFTDADSVYANDGASGALFTTVAGFISKVLSSAGSSVVGFIQSGVGSVVRTVQDALRERVSVLDFMTEAQRQDVLTRTSAIPVSAAVQAALDSLPASGGVLFMPKGRYLWDAPVKTKNNITVRGEGDATEILVNTDIEVFNSDTTTVSTALFGAWFRDFFINKTVTGATTKYDIHLQNPNFCQIRNVHVKSGHDDSSYSATNVGGVFLDKPPASTASAFMNRLNNCWIQNNSVYFRNLTDSSIKGGFVWGHTRQFAIRLTGGGANAVENLEGLICSKYNGGIWIDGVAVNQIRIIGNEFDGNPLLDTGTGVYSPQSSVSVVVKGNTFWGCDKHGIDTVDPVGWTVTGNAFWKNNSADNFYDDVRITGKTFSPNGNVVSGNSHVMDVSRTNKGYAIREVNDGFNPINNTYSANGVSGTSWYQSTAILVLQTATVIGNSGAGTENLNALQGNSVIFGSGGAHKNANAILAANGTLDMVINSSTYLGQPGGGAGIVSVSATRSNFATQSRRQVYFLAFIGTNATFTQIGSNVDGSGGGPSFTLTMPSAGVVRFTDTSATPLNVEMSFFGVKQ